MHITATDLNKHPGMYLTQAIKEPIIIEKSGRPTVVMVSYEKYLELEDAFWGESAKQSDKDKSIGKKKTQDFLKSDK